MGERETITDGEYSGNSYEIIRTDEEQHTSGFEYEFLLYIDGERITTASNLETRGYVAPWVGSLETYAFAFIDGMVEGSH